MPSLKDAKLRRNLEVQTIRYTNNDKYNDLGKGRSYYIFTYGCQGNEADSSRGY